MQQTIAVLVSDIVSISLPCSEVYTVEQWSSEGQVQVCEGGTGIQADLSAPWGLHLRSPQVRCSRVQWNSTWDEHNLRSAAVGSRSAFLGT